MKRTEIVIYGAGGFGREIAWLAESSSVAGHRFDVVCFVDDEPANHGKTLNGVEVMGLAHARSRYPEAKMVVAVGSPELRERLALSSQAFGFRFATLVHPRVELSRWVDIAEGTVVCAGNILTTNITLKEHVQINLDCTIGHDVVMAEFATLAPGAHVSGCVHIGRRVYVGTGAVLINGSPEVPLTIGDDAVIGAGACVIRSVPPGATVVGVPAKQVERH